MLFGGPYRPLANVHEMSSLFQRHSLGGAMGARVARELWVTRVGGWDKVVVGVGWGVSGSVGACVPRVVAPPGECSRVKADIMLFAGNTVIPI